MSTYLTVSGCAELLAVDHKTVRRLIDRGDLPALRVGRVLRIDQDDLERLRYQPGAGATSAPRRPRPRPVTGEFAKRSKETTP